MLQQPIIDTPSPFAMMCQAMTLPLIADLEFGAELDTETQELLPAGSCNPLPINLSKLLIKLVLFYIILGLN